MISRISCTRRPVASSSGTSAEAALRQRGLGVALGPAGVDEAEPVLLDAEDVAGALHLLAAHLGDVLEDLGAVHLRVEDRAALTTGAGDDVDVDALGDVLGGRRSPLARLVVRVGVHVHQPESGPGSCGHRSSVDVTLAA